MTNPNDCISFMADLHALVYGFIRNTRLSTREEMREEVKKVLEKLKKNGVFTIGEGDHYDAMLEGEWNDALTNALNVVEKIEELRQENPELFNRD